jgi:hypothetical protein
MELALEAVSKASFNAPRRYFDRLNMTPTLCHTEFIEVYSMSLLYLIQPPNDKSGININAF